MKLSSIHAYATLTLLVANICFLVVAVYSRVSSSSLRDFLNKFCSPDLNPKPYAVQSSYTDPLKILSHYPIDLENATAVFNTVQSALKQKDSNVNPVGVSFIPAYIPANTRLYHSRSSREIPSSYQWVAFSSEYSYSFGSFSRKVQGNEEDMAKDPRQDVLFTFRAKHSLDKLIYLDGASAAKVAPKMDQQAILSNITDASGKNEEEAAKRICKWGQKFGLQGFIRLEIGFEMVLCDFHRDLELVSNITLAHANDVLDFPRDESKYLPREPWKLGDNHFRFEADWSDSYVDYNSSSFNRTLLLSHLGVVALFDWTRSGSVIDDGEIRILLDLSGMVTPLNKTYIDPDSYRRNISYISQDLKDDIVSSLEKVLQTPVDPFYKTNWQGLTQAVVDKFSFLLINLNNTLSKDVPLKEKSDRIQILTYNVVRRYTHGEFDAGEQKDLAFREFVQDFVYHTFPLRNTDTFIYASVAKVVAEIGDLIFHAFNVSKTISSDIYITNGSTSFDTEINSLRQRVVDFLNILDWASFYGCSKKCGPDQLCFTPTWGPGPFGYHAEPNEFFTYDGQVHRLNYEFKCVSYNDMAPSIPQLN